MPCRRQTSRTAAQVRQADRLAAAAVVGHRDHAERDALRRRPRRSAPRACARSMFPLNGWRLRGCFPSSIDEVDGLRAGVLDVGPGGVEVVVARDDLAGPADQLEQDALAGPPLVGGQDVRHAGQVARAPPRSGYQLRAPAYDSSPRIMPAHCSLLIADVPLSVSRSMMHVLGRDLEQVEVGRAQDRLALARAW